MPGGYALLISIITILGIYKVNDSQASKSKESISIEISGQNFIVRSDPLLGYYIYRYPQILQENL